MIEPATGPRPLLPSEGSGIELQSSIKSLNALSEAQTEAARDPQTSTVPKKAPLKKKSSVVISRMNQYAQFDKNHPLAQPFPAIEGFKGPKCRLWAEFEWKEGSQISVGSLFRSSSQLLSAFTWYCAT